MHPRITEHWERVAGDVVGTPPFLEPGRLDQWKVVCLMIITADGMVTRRSHLISKQFYVGLCKLSLFSDGFDVVTSEDQVLRGEALILRTSLEVDKRLCLDWKDLQ